MMTRCLRPLLFLISCLTVAKGDLSTTPPPAYDASIRSLLTPLAEVAKRKDPHAGKDEPGTIRLAEQVTLVAEDGSYLRAVHYIYQPYSEKGAEMIANDRFRFYSHQETVHLALARTVLADGTEKPLGPNAAFVQKGRRGSGSIYDDAQDLVVVFPDTKAGVLCEVIVVYERKVPAVKGGYSEVMDWSAGWPVGERRSVVDVSKAWDARLKSAVIGKRVATVTDLAAPEGRLRREWKREAIAASKYEPNPAPAAQAGPATWVSTFASWDEMAAWYQGLLAGRDGLDDELKAKVDAWTAGATTPRDVLELLYDHVANDVRYEGLEFGISGLQPYACETVWKNQYGDCKDKANLLVAMLRHKGIAAKVVLVNTDHAGVVSKDLPDYRHFNHAIAVAELPGKDGAPERVFCDATISHGRPGLLGPGSADREALAIDGGKAQWLRTPATDAGEDFYQFEMELNAEGRLSGWLTVTSRGYYGVRLADGYAGVDRETARERAGGLVTDFIAGAEVVDFVLPDVARKVDEAVLKVYFTGPARQANQDGRLSVRFPSSPGLFNDYGDGKPRQTSYFQWRDRIRVEAAVRLPDGWQPESLPQPLKLDTRPYLASASWSHDGNVCRASLLLECREAVIAADAVAAPAQANRALTSWLEVPLLLKQGKHAPAAAGEPVADAALPLMPTGEGQLELVNRLYPAGSDAATRRAALEKVLRFFPNDPATGFSARVELVYLKFLAGDHKAAVEGFAELTRRQPEGVDAETFGHARYLLGMSRHEVGERDAAIAILRELAADQALSDYRRGWSAALAGEWLSQRRPVPAEAIQLLRQAVVAEADCRESALVVLLPAMVAGGEGEALVTLLADGEELDGLEDGGTEVFKHIAEAAKTAEPGAEELLPWFAKARDQAEGGRKEQLAKACAALDDWLSRGESYLAVRASVVEAIEKLGPQYFSGKEPEGTAKQVEERQADLYLEDRAAWLKLAAGYFRKFEPTPKFSMVLWQFASHVATEERTRPAKEGESLFAALSAAAERLPKSDQYFWECRFTRAWWLRDLGKAGEAEASYRALIADADMPATFGQAAWHGLGEALELQQRWEQAAECYLKFKDQRREALAVMESVLRAGLLQARTGKPDEALATWSLLADVAPDDYLQSALAGEIEDAIAMAADKKATLAQWQRMDTWWKKQFEPYLKSFGDTDPGQPRLFLSDQAEALDLRCRKAVAEKDLGPVVRDLVSVASSVRWLPSHQSSLRVMATTYLRPLRPSSAKAEAEMLEKAAAAVKVGATAALEYCLRLHAGWAFDRGEPTRALELLAGQSDEAPGRSAEHRERSGYLFGMAARVTGKDLERALAYSTAIATSGSGFVGDGPWFVLHADLLVKAGKPGEAVAFLKAKAADPAVKGAPEVGTLVMKKLDELSRQGGRSEALVASVRAFLRKHGPPWYEHVGPANLEDERVGDPHKVLEGNLKRFHDAELFRLRLLIALSDEVPIETREQAYAEAVHDAGTWRKTWKEAAVVWSHVIDDEAVADVLRLPLLWKVASKLAAEGQVEALAGLRAKPVFTNFTDKYEKRYFPLLEDLAKARRDGPEAAKAGLARLAERELDEREFQLASAFYAFLLEAGDLAGAEAASAAMKSWKLAPEAAGSRISTRLSWMRLAGVAKEMAGLHEVLRATFKDRVEASAAKAPEGWQDRIDLGRMDDLTDEQADGVRAAMVTTGIRLDRTSGRNWFLRSDFWLQPEHPDDRAKVLSVIPHIVALKNDGAVNLVLAGLLSRLPALPDGGWADVEEAFAKAPEAGKRGSIEAMLAFWRACRSFKPGDPVDVEAMLRTAKEMGVLGVPVQVTTMQALLASGDKKGLETMLERIDAEAFSEVFAIGTYLEALRVVERAEERELVMESAERVIREQMMTAWLERSPSAIRHASDLAIQCGRTDLLPEAWRKDLADVTADKLTAAMVRARLAGLQGEWETVRKTLAEVEGDAGDDDPGWFWLMARAQVELGHPELARPHLERIIKIGLLEGTYYWQAVTALKGLGTHGKDKDAR